MFERFETVAGYSCLAATIVTSLLFDIGAAVRVAGVGVMLTGVIWILRQSVPMGIEGKPPSHCAVGTPAVLLGLAMAVLGLVLLVSPSTIVCWLGWEDPSICH
jgi:hypothetical protein